MLISRWSARTISIGVVAFFCAAGCDKKKETSGDDDKSASKSDKPDKPDKADKSDKSDKSKKDKKGDDDDDAAKGKKAIPVSMKKWKMNLDSGNKGNRAAHAYIGPIEDDRVNGYISLNIDDIRNRTYIPKDYAIKSTEKVAGYPAIKAGSKEKPELTLLVNDAFEVSVSGQSSVTPAEFYTLETFQKIVALCDLEGLAKLDLSKNDDGFDGQKDLEKFLPKFPISEK